MIFHDPVLTSATPPPGREGGREKWDEGGKEEVEKYINSGIVKGEVEQRQNNGRVKGEVGTGGECSESSRAGGLRRGRARRDGTNKQTKKPTGSDEACEIMSLNETPPPKKTPFF